MSARRTAFYGVGGALLFAYLAAANMPSPAAPSPDRPHAVATSGSDSVADEVRAQAVKLQARMAQAPAPDEHSRNPFSFAARPRPARDTGMTMPGLPASAVAPPPAVLAPSVPALTLMGVAEETLPAGVRRTAVIGGEGDTIYMVVEGQPVGERYKVTRIGADAVELEDLLTHGYRRIAMR